MTAQPKSAELQASTPIVGQKVINLALQGGGSHGAFTWGVLDRLLEDAYGSLPSAGHVRLDLLVSLSSLGDGAREVEKVSHPRSPRSSRP